jgi:hypothetical protein
LALGRVLPEAKARLKKSPFFEPCNPFVKAVYENDIIYFCFNRETAQGATKGGSAR